MEQDKTKGGRPALGNRRRHNKITVAFTDTEFKELELKATAANVKISVLVAGLAMHGQVVPKYSEEDKAFEISLKRIANNVNTIAKTLQYFKQNHNQSGVDKEIIKLETVLSSIRTILK